MFKKSCCKLKACCCKLKPQKCARTLKEGAVGTRSFILILFFLGLVTIRTNFLKGFAVRAVWNALQPQISVINVVSNLI